MKPTKMLELSGAYKKNPSRKRPPEPIPTADLGNPPKSMTKEEKVIWKELASIAPPDVLKNADRWTVELAVRLMARVRDSQILTGSELSSLITLTCKLGMNPCDRARINIPEPKPKANPFDEL